MEDWKNYNEQLEKFREEFKKSNYDVEQNIVNFQLKIEDAIEQEFDDQSLYYNKLLRELKAVKKEFDSNDEEGEFDIMLPDHNDEDFDNNNTNIYRSE